MDYVPFLLCKQYDRFVYQNPSCCASNTIVLYTKIMDYVSSLLCSMIVLYTKNSFLGVKKANRASQARGISEKRITSTHRSICGYY